MIPKAMFLCLSLAGLPPQLEDKDLAAIPVVEIYPYKMSFACKVNAKGNDPVIIKRLAQLISDLSLVGAVYRYDRESAIQSMIGEAAVLSERSGKPYKLMEDEDAEDASIMNAIDAADAH